MRGSKAVLPPFISSSDPSTAAVWPFVEPLIATIRILSVSNMAIKL